MRTIGEWVREEREKRGMDMTEFACVCGCGRSTIKRVEAGAMPGASVIKGIMKQIGKPQERLQGWELIKQRMINDQKRKQRLKQYKQSNDDRGSYTTAYKPAFMTDRVLKKCLCSDHVLCKKCDMFSVCEYGKEAVNRFGGKNDG